MPGLFCSRAQFRRVAFWLVQIAYCGRLGPGAQKKIVLYSNLEIAQAQITILFRFRLIAQPYWTWLVFVHENWLDCCCIYNTHTHTHTHIYIYIYIYIYSGGKIFDPLLILYVCPLTKKWSVYNFNGRFIWTVRDKKTTKKSICILISQISIWPLRKTCLILWWQNPCWQSQRSDVSCSWPPGLHTSREGFWIHSSLHILSKSLRFWCWRLATRTFNSLHSFFYGTKVWRLARPLQDLNVLLLNPLTRTITPVWSVLAGPRSVRSHWCD